MTKKLKKTTAFLSAVAMVMAMLLYFPSGMFSNIDWGLKASAEGETQTENWIAFAATEFAGGTGTEGDPYQIATADQLACLAKQVNAGTNYSGVFFKLTADIDLGGKEWTPIGTSSNSFKGKFSGDGHKIKNLTINSESFHVGLFGFNGGTIKNVGIESGSVTGTGDYIGGVCGYNEGGSISNCYNTGSVTGKNYVGGVCGYNEGGTISNCYNTGSVTGTGSAVGGVCGGNSGTISNCYNTGNVSGSNWVGGVCGYNQYGTITNCYNTGSVTGNTYVGGVCGENFEANSSNCYYLKGTAEKGIGSGPGSADPKTLNELCASLPNNFDTNIWTAGSAPTEITTIAEGSRFGKKVYTLPSLNGVGTAQTISVDVYNFSTTDEPDWQDYTPIRTAEELQAIGKDSTSLGKNYVLMEDIDLKDITNFTPIGTDIINAFTGKFSGDGHKIKKLTINSESSYIGLFSFNNGTIMNVGIEGGSVTGTGYDVGGVCGYNFQGTISNCYNTGAVSGNEFVGGVCGLNDGGTIENCYNTGAVSGTYNVGGVCGYNFAYSSDTATATATIENCYNRGTVSGSSDVGGVCGYNSSGSITNCYFDSTVYNNGTAVGNNDGTVSENVLGKTTKQFTSGEVAYLLSQDGSVWGQEIGKDLYPVLGGKKVLANSDQSAFANDIIIYGQSATLDGMIGMNIYVVADDNYEWSASFNGNSVEKPAKDENGLYKFTFKVAAKDMAKNIDFYINENVNATVSVSGYLTELKKSESENTKLANLVTAMETYGNAANAFFNGKSVAEVTGIAENAFDDYTFTMGDPPYGISYYGSSLILESETTIRHYFKLPEGCEAESLKFGAGTEQGNPVEKQGYYYVEIKNISAEKLGNPFSVSVDGDAVISNYSALSYAKAVLESENTDANLKNLVKALYIYYQNAIAYNEPAKEDLK